LRWTGDEQERGVADAGRSVPNIAALLQAAQESGWVAEEPDRHLLPNLIAQLDPARPGLALTSWRIDDGALVLTLSRPESLSARETRSAIFRLLGSVAESATFIREFVEAGSRRYEICTGTLAGDGPFASHGHVLSIVVRGPGGSVESAHD
jgi:hypothetical protein